ncbi:hypothetical protein MJT46_009219, partial [Ovis ammon polii x Ovis aries]
PKGILHLSPDVYQEMEASRHKVISGTTLGYLSPKDMNQPSSSFFSISPTSSSSATIARELLMNGTSSTAEAIGLKGSSPTPPCSPVQPSKQLEYLARIQGFQVHYCDRQSGKEHVTCLTLAPVQMTFHAIGSSIEASHDQAEIMDSMIVVASGSCFLVVACGLLIAAASLAVEHGLWSAGSSSRAQAELSFWKILCGVFLDQGSNGCPLHWQIRDKSEPKEIAFLKVTFRYRVDGSTPLLECASHKSKAALSALKQFSEQGLDSMEGAMNIEKGSLEKQAQHLGEKANNNQTHPGSIAQDCKKSRLFIRAVSEGDISLVTVKVANVDLGGRANICEPLMYMNHPVVSGIKTISQNSPPLKGSDVVKKKERKKSRNIGIAVFKVYVQTAGVRLAGRGVWELSVDML